MEHAWPGFKTHESVKDELTRDRGADKQHGSDLYVAAFAGNMVITCNVRWKVASCCICVFLHCNLLQFPYLSG